jgi:MSHA biogenesis protein MshQ
VANACTTTFNRAGLIVSATSGGAAALPSQVAGTASSTLYLRSVKQSTTTQACEAGVSGNKTVNWAYRCNDPATCGGTSLMSIDGTNGSGTATAIKGASNTGTLAYTGVSMTFDANGEAPFKLNFVDVGQTTVSANVTATNNDVISGTAGPFVTKPAGFTLTNIVNASSVANPAAADDTGSAFTKAGANFSARITAVTSTGAATPNFGKESTPEGVVLKPTLVQPSAGTVGTMTNGTIAGGQFTAGIANVTNLAYSEVGVMKLTGAIADSDYLGAGDTSSTPSANIGRFFPAGFTVTSPTLVNRSALACPTSTFTYLDENFRLGFKLNAVNVQGNVTKNYAAGFAKLGLTASSVFNLAGIDTNTSTRFDSTRITPGASTGTWPPAGNALAGTADVTLTAAAKRGATPGGPYTTASFGIAPVDSDSVAMAAFDIDTDPSSGVNDRASVGQIPLRQGRLRLQNGMGAANRDIKLALSAEYWNGTAYVTNALDSCTTVTAANLSYGNFRKQLTSGDGAMNPASVTLNAGGPAFITLTKPSGNRVGSLDVAISLDGTAPENSCLKPSWTPAVAATAGANVVGLRGGWCNATNDPSARAVWGIYRGSNGTVYQRENY